MLTKVLAGMVMVGSLAAATAEGGIFARGGGCANGMCGVAAAPMRSYYAITSPAVPATAAQVYVPRAQPAAPAIIQSETRTQAYPASATRIRAFRRWVR